MSSYDLIMEMGGLSIESPLFLLFFCSTLWQWGATQTPFIMVERTTIKFEDMPKAMAYLIEKVEELDRKLESLGDTSASCKDVWMGIKELYAHTFLRVRLRRLSMNGRAHILFRSTKGEAHHVPEIGDIQVADWRTNQINPWNQG